jgi:hypothetical protein
VDEVGRPSQRNEVEAMTKPPGTAMIEGSWTGVRSPTIRSLIEEVAGAAARHRTAATTLNRRMVITPARI